MSFLRRPADPGGTPRRRVPADRRAPRFAPPHPHSAGRARQAARTEPARRSQQQLIALGVQLGLARRLAERDALELAASFDALQAAPTDALENLRELAHAIYPPLLADQGLVAALEAQARKAALPVEVGGIGRYPQEVETAVYFCCLEALQNVAKYADGSNGRVRLADQDWTITFEVADDGTGFDSEHTPLVPGLQGMKDRLEALGGSLEIKFSSGSGTGMCGVISVEVSVPT